MPKLIETNLKSKHEDSFRILKSHGYDLYQVSPNTTELFLHPMTKSTVHIYPDGKWNTYHYNHSEANGKSHSDLKVHLDRIHK